MDNFYGFNGGNANAAFAPPGFASSAYHHPQGGWQAGPQPPQAQGMPQQGYGGPQQAYGQSIGVNGPAPFLMNGQYGQQQMAQQPLMQNIQNFPLQNMPQQMMPPPTFQPSNGMTSEEYYQLSRLWSKYSGGGPLPPPVPFVNGGFSVPPPGFPYPVQQQQQQGHQPQQPQAFQAQTQPPHPRDLATPMMVDGVARPPATVAEALDQVVRARPPMPEEQPAQKKARPAPLPPASPPPPLLLPERPTSAAPPMLSPATGPRTPMSSVLSPMAGFNNRLSSEEPFSPSLTIKQEPAERTTERPEEKVIVKEEVEMEDEVRIVSSKAPRTRKNVTATTSPPTIPAQEKSPSTVEPRSSAAGRPSKLENALMAVAQEAAAAAQYEAPGSARVEQVVVEKIALPENVEVTCTFQAKEEAEECTNPKLYYRKKRFNYKFSIKVPSTPAVVPTKDEAKKNTETTTTMEAAEPVSPLLDLRSEVLLTTRMSGSVHDEEEGRLMIVEEEHEDVTEREIPRLPPPPPPPVLLPPRAPEVEQLKITNAIPSERSQMKKEGEVLPPSPLQQVPPSASQSTDIEQLKKKSDNSIVSERRHVMKDGEIPSPSRQLPPSQALPPPPHVTGAEKFKKTGDISNQKKELNKREEKKSRSPPLQKTIQKKKEQEPHLFKKPLLKSSSTGFMMNSKKQDAAGLPTGPRSAPSFQDRVKQYGLTQLEKQNQEFERLARLEQEKKKVKNASEPSAKPRAPLQPSSSKAACPSYTQHLGVAEQFRTDLAKASHQPERRQVALSTTSTIPPRTPTLKEDGYYHCHRCRHKEAEWHYLLVHLEGAHPKDVDHGWKRCSICMQWLPGEVALASHRKSAHDQRTAVLPGVRPFRAPSYVYGPTKAPFDTEKKLRLYYKSLNSSSEARSAVQFACERCPARFNTKEGLNFHLEKDHHFKKKPPPPPPSSGYRQHDF